MTYLEPVKDDEVVNPVRFLMKNAAYMNIVRRSRSHVFEGRKSQKKLVKKAKHFDLEK